MSVLRASLYRAVSIAALTGALYVNPANAEPPSVTSSKGTNINFAIFDSSCNSAHGHVWRTSDGSSSYTYLYVWGRTGGDCDNWWSGDHFFVYAQLPFDALTGNFGSKTVKLEVDVGSLPQGSYDLYHGSAPKFNITLKEDGMYESAHSGTRSWKSTWGGTTSELRSSGPRKCQSANASGSVAVGGTSFNGSSPWSEICQYINTTIWVTRQSN